MQGFWGASNGMKEESVSSGRIAYLDYLRVFATFGVILIHVSAQNWYTTDVRTVNWQIFNVYDSLVRWPVPVFVMISGAVFLGREWNIKTIFSKHILRLTTAFLFWGLIYALFKDLGIANVIRNVIAGHPHMWFIPMIIGLYIGIPIFQKITESQKLTKYFLAVSFVSLFALPQIRFMYQDLRLETGAFQDILSVLTETVSQVKGSLIAGYACYFVAGYYFSKTELSKKARVAIYWLGALGFLSTIFLDAFYSIRHRNPVEYYYDSYTVNVLLESIAVFVWFRYHVRDREKWKLISQNMAKYSFGAYLVHILILDQLYYRFGLNTLSFQPILSVPVIGLIVFVISFAISGLLNQIPVLKRYIV